MAPLSMVAIERRAIDVFGNGESSGNSKEIVTSSMAHADLVAKVVVMNNNHISVSNEDVKRGDMAALSRADMPVNNIDLWNQLMQLRGQVERLEELMAIRVNTGSKEMDLWCQVCGFHLKARMDLTQQNKTTIRKEHALGGDTNVWVVGPGLAVDNGQCEEINNMNNGLEGSGKPVSISQVAVGVMHPVTRSGAPPCGVGAVHVGDGLALEIGQVGATTSVTPPALVEALVSARELPYRDQIRNSIGAVESPTIDMLASTAWDKSGI